MNRMTIYRIGRKRERGRNGFTDGANGEPEQSGAHSAVYPPSTGEAFPVTNDVSSEASQTTVLATSSG